MPVLGGFLLLALVQAVTEFLPVSSSGHLVLVQAWLGFDQETDFIYDILLHLATVFSVLVYFRKDIVGLVRGGLGGPSVKDSIFAGCERRSILMILLTMIPTAILGLFVKKVLLDHVLDPRMVGAMLILTGTLLWSVRGRDSGREMGQMSVRDALLIGLFQGIAVIPGISRAGATIAGSILLGFKRDMAARFSLLISVPAIIGVNLLSIVEALQGAHALPPVGPTLLGMALAAVVGYFAIALIILMVRKDSFYRFAWYLWPVGLLALLLG